MVLTSKQVSSYSTLDWGQNLVLQDELVTLLGLPEQPQSSRNGINIDLQMNNMNGQREEPQQAEALTSANNAIIRCPRCDSANTKFCYYNNYNRSQPRHFCKTCRRHWTKGGTLRNVPVGGGRKKNMNNNKKKKRLMIKSTDHSSSGSSAGNKMSSASTSPGGHGGCSTGTTPRDQYHHSNSVATTDHGPIITFPTQQQQYYSSPSDHQILVTRNITSWNSENYYEVNPSLPSTTLHESSSDPLIEFAEDQFTAPNGASSTSPSSAAPRLMPPSNQLHFTNYNLLDPGFWNWDDLPTSSTISPADLIKYLPYLDDPHLGV